MNSRRGFLSSMLKAGAVFTILPGAGRVWVPTPPEMEMFTHAVPGLLSVQLTFKRRIGLVNFYVRDLIDPDDLTPELIKPYRQNAEAIFKRREA